MDNPGLQEARRCIEAAARDQAEELDLGGLRLTEIPEELYAVRQLKVLYLGTPKHLQKIPYWDRDEGDREKCNWLRALPPALFTSLPDLTHLYLDQNRMSEVPAEIAALSGLISLDLSRNRLGDTSARALAARNNLTSLDLSENRIRADGARALTALTSLTLLNLSGNWIDTDGARALAALTGLTSLDLGGNPIGDNGVQALTALSGLTTLRLGNNQISAVGARALAALTSLTSLHLGNNRIGDDGARALSALTSLVSLTLGGNRISTDGAQALTALTGLTRLYLWNNRIGDDGARVLTTLTSLTSLDLSHNRIGDEDYRIGDDGARALTALTSLTSLNLSDNRISTDGARALAALTGLTSLDLEGNGIGDDGAWALTAITALTSLNLGRNRIGDEGNRIGDEGARALTALTSLTSLNLSGNQIGDDGARALAVLTGLTSLDLEGNWIGDNGVQALTALRGLTTLRLGNNQISDNGARALTALTSLTSLNLSDNQIGDDGARGLTALTGLTSLDLWNNRIGNDGARALTALTGLTSIHLSGNQIGNDGAQALTALTGLTSLYLSDNQIGDDGARTIAALTGLTSLGLGKNRIGANGARALTSLAGLTSLSLLNNHIGDDGARALAALTGLTSLDLENSQIGDGGVRALIALTGLTSLDLRKNQIGDGGARALTALTGLTSLYLNYTQVGDDTASALAMLTGLTHLNLSGSRVSSLSPLLNLTGLRQLICSGCRLTAPIPPIWTLPFLDELILHRAVLPGIPPEVLSQDDNSSCLESLRAHFDDLERGASEVEGIKFMILGNGRVGKTQICRRLQGKEYDDAQPSTHGIEVSSVPLALSATETITLKIWDFGGQDIYHSTHALFLKSRALFPLVWTPQSEAEKEHAHGGFTFRNQPLGYWLAYVRAFGVPDSPVLVIQSQCDEAEQEWLIPPAPREALDVFPFKKVLHYSARNNRGRAALDEAMADAVRWLRRHLGVDKIGKGRAKVNSQLEGMIAAGKRLITYDEFTALCNEVSQKAGAFSSLELLLDYLHNCGTVFYRKGLFGNAIILDQTWALDAVYAAFDRNFGTFRNIERYGGRFRRSDLAQWVWQRYTEKEQKLFLSFMQQCGICFILRRGGRHIEDEYVAPDLLPRRNAPEIAVELRQKWDPRCDAEETLSYDLLPPVLMRSLTSKIGNEAGLAATYWRGGFYFYDERTGSRALVEQRWTEGWAGEIRVQTQRGKAELLLERVLELIDEEHEKLGARPRGGNAPTRSTKRYEREFHRHAVAIKAGREPSTMAVTMMPGHEPSMAVSIKPGHEPSTRPEYLVSYGWGDNTKDGRKREAVVKRFCDAAAAKGVKLIYDRNTLRPGDRTSVFIERIGRGDRIFIFLSDKYLKSTYCMTELFEVWRNCRQDDAAFIAHTRIYVLPCARIGTLAERTQYVLYWRAKFEETDALVKAHGPGILADADLADYRRMETFVGKTPDMLRLVLDVLNPRAFEDFVEYGLDDPPQGR
jgi:internalin A